MHGMCERMWASRRLRATVRVETIDASRVFVCARRVFSFIPSSVFVLLGYASSEVSSCFGSGAASWKTPLAGGGFGVDPGGHMRRMLVAFSGMQ